MLIAVLFAALMSFTYSSKIFTNQCSKELEGIVYSPNFYYKDYLIGISRELKHLASFYDTPEGRDIVTIFSAKYKLVVGVFDAMGGVTIYQNGKVFTPTKEDRGGQYSSHDAIAVLNLGSYNNAEFSYVYSFLSFSKNGVVYQVTLSRPKDYPPNF